MSRRARITPELAGIPAGVRRRVPGLRREEVAVLAGVSVEYYTRLERGNLAGVSDNVLEAIAGALHLDAAEQDHLYDLARTANPSPRDRPALPEDEQVRDSARHTLNAITEAPAFLRNERRDILAANPLGHALYAQMFEDSTRTPNTARYIFLDSRAPDFYADWDLVSNNVVAILRSAAGRHPDDRKLRALVAELSERSSDFRVLWASHDVRHHYTGVKHYRHPLVGRLDLLFESMPLQPDAGLSLTVYPAVPGSSAEQALHRLAALAGVQPGLRYRA